MLAIILLRKQRMFTMRWTKQRHNNTVDTYTDVIQIYVNLCTIQKDRQFTLNTMNLVINVLKSFWNQTIHLMFLLCVCVVY